MKKLLLSSCLALCAAGAVQASYTLHFPGRFDAEGNELPEETLGQVTGVSPTGQWAAICDEEDNHAYLWNLDNPDTMTCIDWLDEAGIPGKTLVYDVSDNGVAVGSMYFTGGTWKPGVYRDGAWEVLPMHETALTLNYAIRISADSRIIGGIQVVKDEGIETGKGYRACRWTLNEEGDYDLETFVAFPPEVDHHQGFWMSDMSDDGKTIFGHIMCGKTQCHIPAMCVEGEYIYWNHVEAREEPWYYRDQFQGYDTEYYIDGFKDTADTNNFQGGFNYYDDATGLAYGHRTRAFDVDEKGNGTLVRGACIYDTNTGEWTDDTDNRFYNAANGSLIFTRGTTMLVDGQKTDMMDYYNLATDARIDGIQDLSWGATVLGGMHSVTHPGTMEEMYFPLVIVADTAAVEMLPSATEDSEAEYYTLQGMRVHHPAAGLYIVKRGDKVTKQLIK